MTLFQVLKEFPAPGWILFIALLLCLIVELFHKREDIKKIIDILKKFFIWLLTTVRRIKRQLYDRCLSSEEYLDWQKQVLKIIYGPIIEEYNSNDSFIKCEKVNFPVGKDDVSKAKDMKWLDYDAVCFKSEKQYEYPFSELMKKEEVNYGNFVDEKGKPTKYKYEKKGGRQKYYRLLKRTIPFPNNIGYMLSTLNLDKSSNEELFHLKLYTDRYIENVCTSHYLGYELYKLFKKKYAKRIKKAKQKQIEYVVKESSSELLSLLPYRNEVHTKLGNDPKRIFTDGSGRVSLMSVSMMVACKNINGKYDMLRIRRSSNVDAKVGFLQFIPSGGFSSLTEDNDFDAQYANASVVKGVFRELLEECFGEEDYSGRKELSTEEIYNHPIIKKLVKLFDKKDNDTKMYFLGTAMGLSSLRQDLCFLLVIDDLEIASQIRPNEECNTVINCIDVDRIMSLDYWMKYGEEETDLRLLNGTSAALLQLTVELDAFGKISSSK